MQNKKIIQRIKECRIQLSNICNLSTRHLACPASKEEKEQYLPLKNIMNCIIQLRQLDYKGDLGFHIYNEPLLDPRLLYILDFTRHVLLNKIIIWSNKTLYTDELGEEIKKFGNIHFVFSDYLLPHHLDNRLTIYRDSAHPIINKRCLQPYYQLNINYNGDVVLCCYDWKWTKTYGNIKRQKLEDILISEKMNCDYRNLKQGELFKFCTNCTVNFGDNNAAL